MLSQFHQYQNTVQYLVQVARRTEMRKKFLNLSVFAYSKVKRRLIDVSNQITSYYAVLRDKITIYYTALRKIRKWYRKLFVELIAGEVVVNAFVLCKKYGNQNNPSLL